MYFFFFFNDTATTEIYTLSLHDALPILGASVLGMCVESDRAHTAFAAALEVQFPLVSNFNRQIALDRKSTRLNSSHANISYAVFCLKKKKTNVGTSEFCSSIQQGTSDTS